MTTESNQPSHNVLIVTNPNRRRDEKPFFLKVGAAWPTQDGKGFFVKLHVLPLNGELVLKEPLPDDEPGYDQSDDHFRSQTGRR